MSNKVVAFKTEFINKKRVMFLLYKDGTEEMIKYSEKKEIELLVDLGYIKDKNNYENKQLNQMLLVILASISSFLIFNSLDLVNAGILVSTSVFPIGTLALVLNSPSASKKIKKEYEQVLSQFEDVGNSDKRSEKIDNMKKKHVISEIKEENIDYQIRIDRINFEINRLEKERTLLVGKRDENNDKAKKIIKSFKDENSK